MGRRVLTRGGGALAFIAASMLMGTAGPAETPNEVANEKVVTGFYDALDAADAAGAMRQRIKGIADRYLSPDYVQHSAAFANLPGPGSARDRLVRMFEAMPPHPPGPPPQRVALMAKADMVVLVTSRPGADTPGAAGRTYIFNLFRVAGGRLVEHWDGTSQPIAKPAG